MHFCETFLKHNGGKSMKFVSSFKNVKKGSKCPDIHLIQFKGQKGKGFTKGVYQWNFERVLMDFLKTSIFWIAFSNIQSINVIFQPLLFKLNRLPLKMSLTCLQQTTLTLTIPFHILKQTTKPMASAPRFLLKFKKSIHRTYYIRP